MLTKEELNRLAEFAEKDNEFAEKFNAAVKAKNADEAIRLAAEKGFTLTAEDFAFDGMSELDREELEHVAGGGMCWHTIERNSEKFGCIVLILRDIWDYHENQGKAAEGCTAMLGMKK